MFALSAISYRGAILSLDLPDFVLAATFTVTVGLVIQAALLSAYLALRDPDVLRAIARAWKPSLFAGFMGAFASEFWFLAFAITTAANVRTLALVEVLFAQGCDTFRVQAADHHARARRHRAGGDRRRAAGVGVLVYSPSSPPKAREPAEPKLHSSIKTLWNTSRLCGNDAKCA